MASTKNKQSVSDMVFDIKEKLTDEEYKNIMDGIKKIDEKKYVKIRYFLFELKMREDDEGECFHEIVSDDCIAICQVIDKPTSNLYYNIHRECVIEDKVIEYWDKIKGQKGRWPTKIEADKETSIVICDFEEL